MITEKGNTPETLFMKIFDMNNLPIVINKRHIVSVHREATDMNFFVTMITGKVFQTKHDMGAIMTALSTVLHNNTE